MMMMVVEVVVVVKKQKRPDTSTRKFTYRKFLAAVDSDYVTHYVYCKFLCINSQLTIARVKT